MRSYFFMSSEKFSTNTSILYSEKCFFFTIDITMRLNCSSEYDKFFRALQKLLWFFTCLKKCLFVLEFLRHNTPLYCGVTKQPLNFLSFDAKVLFIFS